MSRERTDVDEYSAFFDWSFGSLIIEHLVGDHLPTCCTGFEVCPSVMIAHEHISRPRRLISTSRTPAHQTAALSAVPLCASDTWHSTGITLPVEVGLGGWPVRLIITRPSHDGKSWNLRRLWSFSLSWNQSRLFPLSGCQVSRFSLNARREKWGGLSPLRQV